MLIILLPIGFVSIGMESFLKVVSEMINQVKMTMKLFVF